MDEPWLVAGLGNPGDRYAGTRHNVGSMIVHSLIERMGGRLRKVRFLPVMAAEVRHARSRVFLATSTTFMNDCGPGFASLARKREVPVERVVACHDEIDLPFGALRLKQGGSTAGHNGLRSLVGALGGDDAFHRVRLGVGRPPGRQDPADYVLQPFPKREEADAAVLVEDAADAVLAVIRDGLAAAQERFNRRR